MMLSSFLCFVQGTKARAIINCDNCNTPRVVYSIYKAGVKMGQRIRRSINWSSLLKMADICGNTIPITIFHAHCKVRCLEFVESQYCCDGSDKGKNEEEGFLPLICTVFVMVTLILHPQKKC